MSLKTERPTFGERLLNLVDAVLVRLLLVAARRRRIGLSALLVRLAIHPDRALNRGASASAHNVLGLAKDIFNEDVKAAFGEAPDFRVYRMHRQIVKAVARAFLPREIDDSNYVSDDPAVAKAKAEYRRCQALIWRRVLKRSRIDAVLTANFCYYAERELAGALESIGVPFIPIHKENIRSPGQAAFYTQLYRDRRGTFTGRRILVYNAVERKIQIDAGVAPPDRIVITGMARLDRAHAARREAARAPRPARRPCVLCFSFSPRTLLPEIVRKANSPPFRRYREALPEDLARLSWTSLSTQVHQAMLTLARENPDLDVRIKTKGVQGENEGETIRRLLQVDELPRNLRLIFGGEPLPLIMESDVVCGFNSTSVLESLAAGKPAVVPRFAEAAQADMKPFVVDFEDAVEYADSVDELVARLRAVALDPPPPEAELSPACRRVITKWLFNADGEAGKRVREAVRAEIEKTEAKDKRRER